MFKTESGRLISYYGEEYGDDINRKIVKSSNKIHTLNELFSILLTAWSKETTYPALQNQYNKKEDPTLGQCAITATLVYDMFGGTIHKIRLGSGGTHYFNKIDGNYIDLTSDQFDLYDIDVEYEPNQEIAREYCGKNQNTLKRFNLLKHNINEVLKNNINLNFNKINL